MHDKTLWIEKTKRLVKQRPKEKNLTKAFIKAIKKRIPNEKYGVLLSGGIDSNSIVHFCKQENPNFICYTVGFKESHDLKYAQETAKELKLTLKTKILNLKELERITKKVTFLLDELNVVKIEIATVLYAALEMAKKDKIKKVFTGLGAEEIFAGYQRHTTAKNVNKECWKGLIDMQPIDLHRDINISKHFNITLLTPFLDKELIKTAMSVKGEEKIKKEHKKYVFRKMMEELGLSKECCWRKKVAAQYGSNINKQLTKLAKNKGFKYKKEYLQSLSNK